jgi:hypothetical protein
MASYGSGVGKWGVGALAAISAVGIAACSGGAGPARIGPGVAGVRFPVVTKVDPGVMDVGAVPTARTHDFPRTAPGGLRLTLDRCELRAPGIWTFSGRVAVPRGKHKATATLDLGFLNGDVGRSTWAHRVTFSGSGPFAVAVPGPQPPEGDPRRPTDDGVSNCDAGILAASVPVATVRASVAPTATPAPFMYQAPGGSIQAFGIGAPLGKPYDPRTISLYAVWSGARSVISTVWVPVVRGERPALVGMGSSNTPCAKISVAIGPSDGDPATQITVTTGFDCGAPADDPESLVETHKPVAGAHGFTWARPAYPGDPEVARLQTNGTKEIWVQGGRSIARATVAHIAATLTFASNSAVPTTPPPERPQLLDSAVTGYLREHPGLTERARVRYRGGWMIFVEDGAGSKPDTAWNYRLLRAGHAYAGWWIEKETAGGGQQRCFDGPSYTTGNVGQDRYAFAMTGDPHWTIQGFVDGQWRTVPTTNGVLFDDLTVPHPAPFPGRLRPVDTTGHVPPCFG